MLFFTKVVAPLIIPFQVTLKTSEIVFHKICVAESNKSESEGMGLAP